MKKFLSILIFQLVIYGFAHAGPDEKFLESSDIEQTKPALQSDPFLQAEYLFHSGDILGAKPLYHDYLSQNPSGKRSYQALFRLGSIDQSSRSFSSAIRFYQILLQRFPKSILKNSARFNMAVCHYELEDYGHAEALFQKVLRSSPIKKSKWEAMVYLARIDEGRMNYEKALSKLKKVYGQIEDKEVRQHAVAVTQKLINKTIGMTQVSTLI